MTTLTAGFMAGAPNIESSRPSKRGISCGSMGNQSLVSGWRPRLHEQPCWLCQVAGIVSFQRTHADFLKVCIDLEILCRSGG